MKTIEIQNFLLTKVKFLPKGKIEEVSTKLQNLEEGSLSFFKVSSLSFKSPLALTLLYWIVPGFACIDRFFVEGVVSGFLKLGVQFSLFLAFNWLRISGRGVLVYGLPVYGWCIYLIVDGFLISNRVKKQNLTTFNTAIG